MLADLAALAERVENEAVEAQAAFSAAKAKAVGLEKLETRHRAEVAALDLTVEQAAIDEVATGAWVREREGNQG
jgi:flagellar FliJ protein